MYLFDRHMQSKLRAMGANIRVIRDETGEAAFHDHQSGLAGEMDGQVAVKGRCNSKWRSHWKPSGARNSELAG
ncbi:Uncharacterised protein [Raoultella ornithinolytica]|nr:Uncharacterised protein [Raoultella ornithinolytica]